MTGVYVQVDILSTYIVGVLSDMASRMTAFRGITWRRPYALSCARSIVHNTLVVLRVKH